MPNKNGTGPEGKGPKTGRGNGCCMQSPSRDNKQTQNDEIKSQKNCGRGQGQQPCGNMTKSD